MSEPAKNPNPFDLLVEQIRAVVREEIGAASTAVELVDAEALSKKLSVPVSWVYEQSRQGNIPTHRIGKYIRFDIREVLASQEKKLTG